MAHVSQCKLSGPRPRNSSLLYRSLVPRIEMAGAPKPDKNYQCRNIVSDRGNRIYGKQHTSISVGRTGERVLPQKQRGSLNSDRSEHNIYRTNHGWFGSYCNPHWVLCICAI